MEKTSALLLVPTQEKQFALPDAEMPTNTHGFMLAQAPWLDWLKKNLGQREWGAHGHASNPFILRLFDHTRTRTNTDQTPWCAATVSTALELTGYKSAHSARAFDYKTYGEKCELKVGAIVVFDFSHVGVVASFDSKNVASISGNQSNSLRVSTYSRKHIVACRWPVK